MTENNGEGKISVLKLLDSCLDLCFGKESRLSMKCFLICQFQYSIWGLIRTSSALYSHSTYMEKSNSPWQILSVIGLLSIVYLFTNGKNNIKQFLKLLSCINMSIFLELPSTLFLFWS